MLERRSACSGTCGSCGGCDSLRQQVRIEAHNPIGAEPGDWVIVESETLPVLKAAALLYLVPLVLFFAGYAVGALWGFGAACGVAGFASGIALAVWFDRRIAAKRKIIYTITGFAAEDAPEFRGKGDNFSG